MLRLSALFALFVFNLLLLAILKIYSPLHICNEISLAELIPIKALKKFILHWKTAYAKHLENGGESLQKLNVSISKVTAASLILYLVYCNLT